MADQEPPGYAWRDKDAAKRMSDGIGFHRVVLTDDEIIAGRFLVIRLSDGWVDPTIYDSRSDALRFAPGLESLYAYPRMPFERLSPYACDVMLWYVRAAYSNGYRPDVADPDRELIIPNRIEDVRSDILRRDRPQF